MNEFILKYQGKELKQGCQWIDGNHTIYLSNRLGKDIVGTSIEEYNINPNPTLFQFNLEIRTINPTHELNTKFNGLFKNCVYGSDNDIAVKVRQFEFEGKVYKAGDVVSTWINQIYAVVRWSYYFNGWALFCYKKEYEGNNDIPLSVCNLTPEMIDKIVIQGNLLDEYLSGEDKLAKICGF